MTTTVTQNKPLADLSGYFYEGQTLNEVKEFSGLTSIFYDEKKEFARIDTDGDGVLSKDEIKAELERDGRSAKVSKICSSITAGCGAFLAGFFKGNGKLRFCYGAIGVLNLASALTSHNKQKKIERRLAEANS